MLFFLLFLQHRRLNYFMLYIRVHSLCDAFCGFCQMCLPLRYHTDKFLTLKGKMGMRWWARVRTAENNENWSHAVHVQSKHRKARYIFNVTPHLPCDPFGRSLSLWLWFHYWPIRPSFHVLPLNFVTHKYST